MTKDKQWGDKGLRLVILVMIMGLLVVAVGLFLPDEAQIERSIIIRSPVDQVFRQVSRLPNHQSWAPWLRHDEDEKVNITFDGNVIGAGAGYQWHISADEAKSRLVVLESIHPHYFKARITGISAWHGLSLWSFHKESPVTTQVTWSVVVESRSLLGRYWILLDELFRGPWLERGLTDLKERSESALETSQIN
jgi:hypothetical protein